MPFVEHLGELRKRIIIALGTFLVSSSVAFGFADKIVHFLMAPVAGMSFVYLSPSELFISYTKLALGGGLIVSLPVIIYEIWAFVQPALKLRARRAIAGTLAAGGLFFVGGAAFAFYVVVPMTIRFFLSYSMPNIQALFSIANYFSFVFDIALSFGVAFELPVICALLGALGILSHELLSKGRRYALLGILIIAAILSPPDVVSQILLALPMYGLYELSILVLRVSGARRRRAVPEAVTLS
jgi:sec-independent protein translocase protein TatC